MVIVKGKRDHNLSNEYCMHFNFCGFYVSYFVNVKLRSTFHYTLRGTCIIIIIICYLYLYICTCVYGNVV